MFRDELRHNVWNEIRQHDLRAFRRFLSDKVFAEAAALAAVKLGHSALALPQMVWLGIVGAIHTSKSFASILQKTLKILEDSSDWRPAALPKPSRKQPQRGRR